MRNHEVNDIVTAAIELVMFGVLCVLLVYFAFSARNMFSYHEDQIALQNEIKFQSAQYFFKYGEHIYGTDVIEFITKYDANFDYIIKFKNGKTYEITKAYASELRSKGQDSNTLWSQEYLTNEVFLDNVYKEFVISTVDQGDNKLEYYINEK